MEKESFEDDEVARYLGEHFVSIKVDKEERPDIDSIYMSVCQAATGSGGWPTTILMTPEQKPFFAGTYFPKRGRYGRPGFMELLQAASKKWRLQSEELTDTGERIAEAVREYHMVSASDEMPGREAAELAARILFKSYDSRYGGFGTPPKFPSPHGLLFLLRCHKQGIHPRALEMTEHTLSQMYKGGIFDHVGFGSSRYSTDEKWLAPHFEKMLYDNALLSIAYLECFQATGNPFYKAVAEKTLTYIEREMTSPEGCFYCAQDADVDGDEGKYYTFTPKEIEQALGKEDAGFICERYDITSAGNFEGKNILNLINSDTPYLPDERTEALLARLYEYRLKRYLLHKDDKALTSWNALMIAAYAKAYRVTGNARYMSIARKALVFISDRLTDKDGRLMVSYRGGTVKGKGLLDDYAFLAWACLEMYESTFELSYLERCATLMDVILSRFSDPSGGFYLSPDDGEELIMRPKEQFDGAVPSGNSVALYCLGKLSALTGEIRWREAFENQLRFYADMMKKQPTACTFALLALLQEAYPSRELICAINDERERETLALALGELFIPQTAVLVKAPQDAEGLAKIAPFTRDYPVPSDHGYAFYLCENHSCTAPFHSIDELKARLNR